MIHHFRKIVYASFPSIPVEAPWGSCLDNKSHSMVCCCLLSRTIPHINHLPIVINSTACWQIFGFSIVESIFFVHPPVIISSTTIPNSCRPASSPKMVRAQLLKVAPFDARVISIKIHVTLFFISLL